MPERRTTSRPDSPDRRDSPRPPLMLNLVLLFLGLAALFAGSLHRHALDRQLTRELRAGQPGTAEILRVREEISRMDVTEEELHKVVEGRLEYVDSLKGDAFYLTIDTKKGKMYFQYGDNVLRETDVQVGEAKVIRSSSGAQWTFTPLRGVFKVQDKAAGLDWQIPEWVYAMKEEPMPTDRPRVPDGLGAYAIFLPNGYMIHSPPSKESPLQGPRPSSFMVPEADLRAIWPRIEKGTPVYVF